MTVGIVGAGITGLTLCHHLAERDVDVRVLEADARPGGVIRSTEADGVILEHGPQRTRRTAAVEALVDAVDIGDEVVTADRSLPLYVYADGQLRPVPTSLRRFLRTDLLSWRAKLRVLGEPLTAPGREDETAAALFRRKFGDEAYENVIGPLFGGIYGSDPARMPAGRALAPLLKREDEESSLLKLAARRLVGGSPPPAISFEAGLSRLPDALAERYGDRVSLGRPVTRIEPSNDGYRVMARGELIAADEVVLTCPAGEAADLIEPLTEETADALRSLTYNPLALVHLQSDAGVEGLGYQVRSDEDLATLGVTWNACRFDRDGLFTAFLGGMRTPDIVDRPPAEIGSLAREEFEAVMDAPADVLNVTQLPHAMPAWDHTWAALDRVSLPDGIHLETNYTGRVGIPSRIREAGELAEQLAAR